MGREIKKVHTNAQLLNQNKPTINQESEPLELAGFFSDAEGRLWRGTPIISRNDNGEKTIAKVDWKTILSSIRNKYKKP